MEHQELNRLPRRNSLIRFSLSLALGFIACDQGVAPKKSDGSSSALEMTPKNRRSEKELTHDHEKPKSYFKAVAIDERWDDLKSCDGDDDCIQKTLILNGDFDNVFWSQAGEGEEWVNKNLGRSGRFGEDFGESQWQAWEKWINFECVCD